MRRAVQDFLERFGYLPAGGSGDAEPERVRAAASRALALYQKRHGLPMTGTFDERTDAQMAMQRCGMPDLHDGLAFCTRGRWPSPQLTFAFDDTAVRLAGADACHAVRRAFTTWALAAPITFTEVPANAGPDVTIAWQPGGGAADPVRAGVLGCADDPPAPGSLPDGPKTIRFDGRHVWANGAVPGAFDVETVALHQIGHILGLTHSDVPGSVMFPSFADDSTNRAVTRDDLRRIRHLYPAAVLPNGTFTIRQRITGRRLDTHEIAADDIRLVGRPPRDSDTQRWQLTKIGTVFLIRQRSTGLYLDTGGAPGHDGRLVARAAAHTGSQHWIAMSDGDGACTLRQLSSRRFMDARQIAAEDFAVVAAPKRDDDAQKWVIRRVGPMFTMRQKSSGRYAAADERAAPTRVLSTSPDPDERWIFCPVGAVFMVIQSSTFQLVDAGGPGTGDGALVTRPPRSDDAQRWIVMPAPCGSYTIQQLGTGRLVDALEAPDDDRIVLRDADPGDSQHWMFDKV